MGNPPRSNLGGHITNARHTDGSNFLIGDGHVKYLKPAQVSPGKDNSDVCTQDASGDCTVAAVGRAANTGALNVTGRSFAATFSVH